ncbi:hypothetical protein NMY22_g1134 [Coprinellus aureogranulatus]|nr:hypothetical protein NMY22_g1134 [Coprinellus aureogranulatus]
MSGSSRQAYSAFGRQRNAYDQSYRPSPELPSWRSQRNTLATGSGRPTDDDGSGESEESWTTASNNFAVVPPLLFDNPFDSPSSSPPGLPISSFTSVDLDGPEVTPQDSISSHDTVRPSRGLRPLQLSSSSTVSHDIPPRPSSGTSTSPSTVSRRAPPSVRSVASAGSHGSRQALPAATDADAIVSWYATLQQAMRVYNGNIPSWLLAMAPPSLKGQAPPPNFIPPSNSTPKVKPPSPRSFVRDSPPHLTPLPTLPLPPSRGSAALSALPPRTSPVFPVDDRDDADARVGTPPGGACGFDRGSRGGGGGRVDPLASLDRITVDACLLDLENPFPSSLNCFAMIHACRAKGQNPSATHISLLQRRGQWTEWNTAMIEFLDVYNLLCFIMEDDFFTEPTQDWHQALYPPTPRNSYADGGDRLSSDDVRLIRRWEILDSAVTAILRSRLHEDALVVVKEALLHIKKPHARDWYVTIREKFGKLDYCYGRNQWTKAQTLVCGGNVTGYLAAFKRLVREVEDSSFEIPTVEYILCFLARLPSHLQHIADDFVREFNRTNPPPKYTFLDFIKWTDLVILIASWSRRSLSRCSAVSSSWSYAVDRRARGGSRPRAASCLERDVTSCRLQIPELGRTSA